MDQTCGCDIVDMAGDAAGIVMDKGFGLRIEGFPL